MGTLRRAPNPLQPAPDPFRPGLTLQRRYSGLARAGPALPEAPMNGGTKLPRRARYTLPLPPPPHRQAGRDCCLIRGRRECLQRSAQRLVVCSAGLPPRAPRHGELSRAVPAYLHRMSPYVKTMPPRAETAVLRRACHRQTVCKLVTRCLTSDVGGGR